MGWFDNQIKQRMQFDEDIFADSCTNMASVIMGKSILYAKNQDNIIKTKNAINNIVLFFNMKPRELPESITDTRDALEYQLSPAGILFRPVKLSGDWYKDSIGPLLGHTDKGDPIALLPGRISGYRYTDPTNGKIVKVTKETTNILSEEAICFYKPLPQKPLKAKDLLIFMLKTISKSDILWVTLASLIFALIGIIAPAVNKLIFNNVIPEGEIRLILPVACLLLGVTLSRLMITVMKKMIIARIQIKMSITVQSAVMMRVMSLPAKFFRRYTAGELANRTLSIGGLCSSLTNAAFSGGLASLFSLVYIGQILYYAPGLIIPALITLTSSLCVTLLSIYVQNKVAKKGLISSAKLEGLLFGLYSGIQKIKLAGAERRAFAKWANMFSENAFINYNPPLFLKLNGVINTAIFLIGTIVMYYFTVINHITVSQYMAFNVSYGMVAAAFAALGNIVITIASVKPTLSMITPVLETVPESSVSKIQLNKLSGGVELNNVTFGYQQGTAPIINNLSIKIHPRQYVAIVGPTGCGKTTLLKLLLGFEEPIKGSIYYDGKDMEKLDLRSLRKNIGSVMQDGKLFGGDIYTNITISAPDLTIQDAWEAAEAAGIAEDIRQMPMGMFTQISEGGHGLSGGQRQRLMIARAIASKPKILMFDEATSALDNITQKKISESLEQLKCTRIVVAHRLSTIKNCDRIIVLFRGRIVEDGNYEELISKQGLFAKLVERQELNSNNNVS